MKDSIEVVLDALRDAEPRPGMEHRILAALHVAAVEPAPQRLRWLWTSAVALAAVAAIVTVWPHHSIDPRLEAPTVRTTKTPGLSVDRDTAAIPTPHAVPSRHPHDVVNAQPVAVSADSTQEASFPAPPLPLTRQEQLMVRLAHASDPAQLAALSPDARLTQFEQEKAEVRAFFTPPALPKPMEPFDYTATVSGEN